MTVEKCLPDVSFSFLKLFEISKNMVACSTDRSFYHSYDFRIYCHDGPSYKFAYKIAYLETFSLFTAPSNQIYKYLTKSPKKFD